MSQPTPEEFLTMLKDLMTTIKEAEFEGNWDNVRKALEELPEKAPCDKSRPDITVSALYLLNKLAIKLATKIPDALKHLGKLKKDILLCLSDTGTTVKRVDASKLVTAYEVLNIALKSLKPAYELVKDTVKETPLEEISFPEEAELYLRAVMDMFQGSHQ